jgi:TPR repeat protein
MPGPARRGKQRVVIPKYGPSKLAKQVTTVGEEEDDEESGVTADEVAREDQDLRELEEQYPDGAHTRADLHDKKLCEDMLQRKDIAGVTKWAKRGSRFAQGLLGTMYLIGQGVKKDEVLGLKWLERAVEAQEYDALYILADHLASEEASVQDLPRARALLQQSAKRGNVDSMVKLSAMCLEGEGEGGQASREQAREWLLQAAMADNVEAMLEYALMLDTGVGGKEDPLLAEYWHNKALEHPHYRALGDQDEEGDEEEEEQKSL